MQRSFKISRLRIPVLTSRVCGVCSGMYEADSDPEASDTLTASAVKLLVEATAELQTARDSLDPMRDEALAAFDAPLCDARKRVHAIVARVKKARKVNQNKKGANKSKMVMRAQKFKNAKVRGKQGRHRAEEESNA